MRLWCKFNLHYWLGPGAWCGECEYPDVIFDDPETAKQRMDAWKEQNGGKDPRWLRGT